MVATAERRAGLAQADLGLMGTGTDARDATRPNHPRSTATSAVPPPPSDLAQPTPRSKGNLFWAFAYNIAAIPLAALDCSSRWSRAAMAFSSVFVVGNSLACASEAPRWRDTTEVMTTPTSRPPGTHPPPTSTRPAGTTPWGPARARACPPTQRPAAPLHRPAAASPTISTASSDRGQAQQGMVEDKVLMTCLTQISALTSAGGGGALDDHRRCRRRTQRRRQPGGRGEDHRGDFRPSRSRSPPRRPARRHP